VRGRSSRRCSPAGAGRISDEEIPGVVGFQLTPDHAPVVTYLGFARMPN
jgi:hypothetical protein